MWPFKKRDKEDEYSEKDKEAFDRADKIHGWIKGIPSRYPESKD